MQFHVQLKHICLAIFLIGNMAYGQTPQVSFSKDAFQLEPYRSFKANKSYPQEMEQQVLTALAYYPELKDTKIIFRFKKRNTPLTSRPRFFHVFKGKKNRAYVITISTKTKDAFAPILFHNLPYNAQIGVLAHEIGHIVTYKKKSSFQILGIAFKLLNAKFVDRFEYDTDLTAIAHGMGHQLYDWSVYVRKALNIVEWNGITNSGQERYMNPTTIQGYMQSSGIYP